MPTIADIKTDIDNHFNTYGYNTTIRKYPLNAIWHGDFPHRDSISNDYPSYSTTHVRCIWDLRQVTAGSIRANWSTNTGATYGTSTAEQRDGDFIYVPANATTASLFSLNFIASSTANRTFNYGRDVCVFLEPGMSTGWYGGIIYERIYLHDTLIMYKIHTQRTDQVAWVFEYMFDINGTMKYAPQVIPQYNQAPSIIYI